jgi:hypothetical protein
MATDEQFHYRGTSRSFCVELLRIKHESRQARWEAVAADMSRQIDTEPASDAAQQRLSVVPHSFNLRRANERREYFAYPKGGVGCQTSALVGPAVTFSELN